MASKTTHKRASAAKRASATKPAGRRARYSAEHKRKVVTEAFPFGGTPRVQTVAGRYKVPPAYIYKWRQQLRKESSAAAATPRSARVLPNSMQQRKDFLEAEINRLLAELKELEKALKI